MINKKRMLAMALGGRLASLVVAPLAHATKTIVYIHETGGVQSRLCGRHLRGEQ